MTLSKLDIDGFLKKELELDEIIQVDKTHIVIHIPGEYIDGEYEIALLSCRTPDRLLAGFISCLRNNG
jgi:hypothetical protein